MKCPNCGNDVEANATVCPNCNLELQNVVEATTDESTTNNVEENTQEIVQSNSITTKNKELKKYLTIFIILLVIFLILVGILVIRKISKPSKDGNKTTKTTTTEPVGVEVSKNKGVYSGLESPVNFGTITLATYEDKTHNQEKNVDVELVRVLNQDEIALIASSGNQQLIDGFMWVGVEYRVTLNDFAYLGDETITPILNVSLHDGYYKNNVFFVNQEYYNVSPIVDANVIPIKNGESTNIRMIYQVPVDQGYYLCFGVQTKTFGCFNKF